MAPIHETEYQLTTSLQNKRGFRRKQGRSIGGVRRGRDDSVAKERWHSLWSATWGKPILPGNLPLGLEMIVDVRPLAPMADT